MLKNGQKHVVKHKNLHFFMVSCLENRTFAADLIEGDTDLLEDIQAKTVLLQAADDHSMNQNKIT